MKKVKNPYTKRIVSLETRKKISKALSGVKHPMYGKTWSEEYKLRHSIIAKERGCGLWMKGKTLSQETKNKIKTAWALEKRKKVSKKLSGANSPWYGKHHSKKAKEKLRLANLGRKMSEASKEKNRLSHLGKHRGPPSNETRTKLRLARARHKKTFVSRIEKKIQGFLTGLNISFVTHKWINILHSYRCDIFVPSLNLVIECDGCYWHACPIHYPNNRFEYHRQKSIIRTQELQEMGYKVLSLWEHEIKNMVIEDLEKKIEGVTRKQLCLTI